MSRMKNYLIINIKPLLFFLLISSVSSLLIYNSWQTENLNMVVKWTFFLTIILYISFGFFLNLYDKWYKNIISVSLIFIISSTIFILKSMNNPYLEESLIYHLYFLINLPFLHILGFSNEYNFPVFPILAPSVLLMVGLFIKYLYYKISSTR